MNNHTSHALVTKTKTYMPDIKIKTQMYNPQSLGTSPDGTLTEAQLEEQANIPQAPADKLPDAPKGGQSEVPKGGQSGASNGGQSQGSNGGQSSDADGGQSAPQGRSLPEVREVSPLPELRPVTWNWDRLYRRAGSYFEDDATKARRERRERAASAIGALGDAIQAAGALWGASKGAAVPKSSSVVKAIDAKSARDAALRAKRLESWDKAVRDAQLADARLSGELARDRRTYYTAKEAEERRAATARAQSERQAANNAAKAQMAEAQRQWRSNERDAAHQDRMKENKQKNDLAIRLKQTVSGGTRSHSKGGNGNKRH